MAISPQQRRALPDSAFAYPDRRTYPVPTAAQARRAGISEADRVATHRNALTRAAQANTGGSYKHVAAKVATRSGGKAVGSVRRKR